MNSSEQKESVRPLDESRGKESDTFEEVDFCLTELYFPDDDDLDVEQCSEDGDSTNKSSPPPTEKQQKKKSKEQTKIRNKCNCEELQYVQCHLETKELWDKFHDYETEMIITKTGR